MPAIHFIEKINAVRKIPGGTAVWETGDWTLAEATAAKLVGGDLYVHTGQKVPSHFGGKILSYRIIDGPAENEGKVIFRIQFSPAYRGVSQFVGWGNEKAISW